jgi:putative ABC transport system permease protein
LSVPLDAMFMDARVVEGRGLTIDDEGANVAVVGVSAAGRNGLEVGDELRLNPQTRLEIVGLVGSSGGFLENVIVTSLTTLQNAIGIVDRFSLLALDLERADLAEDVAAAIEAAYPDLTAQTQSDLLTVMRDALRISDAVRLGISAIALLVGAIAVANTMMMSVFERTREFGVVRAVGAKPRFLFGLVEAESVLLSLVGAAAGVAIGRLGVSVVNRVAENFVGLSVAAVTPRLVGFAVLVALVMGLVSGLVPAARASRIPIAVAVARE